MSYYRSAILNFRTLHLWRKWPTVESLAHHCLDMSSFLASRRATSIEAV